MSISIRNSDEIVTGAALAIWVSLLLLPVLAPACIVVFACLSICLYRPQYSRMTILAVILFACWWLLYALRLPFAADRPAHLFQMEKKLACLVLPLCFLFYRWTELMVYRFARFYVWLVALTGALCLVYAGSRYILYHDRDAFFYHRLGELFQLHAVYFSLYISMATAALVFIPSAVLGIVNSNSLKLFFLLLIILLSSKLFLVLELALFAAGLLRRRRWRPLYWWSLLFLVPVVAVLTRAPVGQRFRDIKLERTGLLYQKQLGDSIYLDGLSFRLLQWQNGLEILQEQHAFISGVSAGDADALYRQKIIAKKWYTGADGQSGFLNYNMHNQYLETWIRTGIAGLMLLTGLFVLALYRAARSGSAPALSVLLLFAFFCCTESVFERQAGIVPFCFILPLCIACGQRQTADTVKIPGQWT